MMGGLMMILGVCGVLFVGGVVVSCRAAGRVKRRLTLMGIIV